MAYLGGGMSPAPQILRHGPRQLLSAIGPQGSGSAFMSIFVAELEELHDRHPGRVGYDGPIYQHVHTDQLVWHRNPNVDPELVIPCMPDFARGFANAIFTCLGQTGPRTGLYWFLCGGEPQRALQANANQAAYEHTRGLGPLEPHRHFHEPTCTRAHEEYHTGPRGDELFRATLHNFPGRLVSKFWFLLELLY